MTTTQQDYGDDDFAKVIEEIRQHELAEQQAAENPPQSEQQAQTPPTDGTQEATPAKTEGEGGTSAEASAPAPAAEKQGDVRAALRASRRAEQRAREEAARLKAELEETRKQIPTPKDESLTDEEIAELEKDMPVVAKALRETRAIKAALPKAAPAPAPADSDFVPPTQPPAVQDAIDEIPDLLDMQNDPDQTAFNLAVQTDALLKNHPKWADKPLTERLAECARRVKAELGESAPAAPTPPQKPAAAPAPATTARRDPAEVVAKAPRAQPSTLSDIAGGAAPTTEGAPSLEQIMNMSEEDMHAALARFG
jgi:hypothetical protein